MTGRITAAAEWKSVPGDAGELDGYMSVFNVLDDGGDVVLPGAFKKTFSDWNSARAPMPLIADHDLSTGGIIGSVSHLSEDPVGARIRARFSSVSKAQDIRVKMVEGHLRGMSFTYDAIRHHRGMFDGKSARFLDECRVYEATVTWAPMNRLALASAKGPAARDSDLADLERLEAWAAKSQAVSLVSDLFADSDLMRATADQLDRGSAGRDLARLEAWAMSAPRADPETAARAAENAERERDNEYSLRLSAWMRAHQ